MSLKEALESVKKKRSVINPNEGFMNQLKAYEGILKARWGRGEGEGMGGEGSGREGRRGEGGREERGREEKGGEEMGREEMGGEGRRGEDRGVKGRRGGAWERWRLVHRMDSIGYRIQGMSIRPIQVELV